MRAIQELNGVLQFTEFPDPEPGAGEVLIRVGATAVNRADLIQRKGLYPPPPGASPILGLECSGIIESVGPGVTTWKPGDRVCALLAGGGYAEKVNCPAGHVLPIPQGYSLEEAAAIPEVFSTAWLNLQEEASLKEGERVLVHAGASGVGTAVIQLCKAWNNPVFATVGSPEKQQFCESLGAQTTANRHQDDWPSLVKKWGGADVIIDPVGGAYLHHNISVLKPRGRLISIGLLGGNRGELPLGRVLVKRLCIKGSVLRSRSIQEKTSIIAALQRNVWPLLEKRILNPIIDSVFPITEVDKAHALLESNQTKGKIILTVDPSL